ncbi:zincin-like metallopeptidase domain-containing protein [Thalassospira xiamenensis]|uniref:zincin-like metallopeptidase domain-containing protein n=1 Tax=Thalassospira xiamenensis TaxID=220697 RepID=UPI000DED763C|nr:zincin-like metallopeptidase domain-containing protein [Thalassospira xiamenensis]
MAKPNFRDQVVESLIEQMERGTAPWQKPWEPGKIREPSFNPSTGKAYRGINQIWLESRGYADPRWVTYRQAQANGYQVRKGEKGTQIEYWQWSERQPVKDNDGNPVLDPEGKQRYREFRLDRPKVFHAVVFNGTQIDGLASYVGMEPDFNPVERAEQALSQLGVPIHYDQRDRAFYQPGSDEIHMPPKGWFKGQYEYYATALHEGGHSTGHESRMAREFGPFGSETYAREELRAEIASFMLTTELGLGHYPERHAPYVKSWMTAIKEDRNILFQAARDAENIRTWIIEPEKRLSLTPVKEQRQEMVEDRSMSFVASYGEREAARRQQAVDGMFEKYPDAHPTLWAMELQDALVLSGSRNEKGLLTADQLKERLLATDLSTDHLIRFLGQSSERANWRSVAETVPGYAEEFAEFAHLAEQFGKIDWVAHYAASPERRLNGLSHREKVLDQMQSEASASPLHRELVSALWDLDGPGSKSSVPVPDWYISADQRKDDFLKRLSKPLDEHPQTSLQAQMASSREEEKVMVENAKGHDPEKKRIYLNVPYSEKSDAKGLGARWDRHNKVWFVHEGTDMKPFAKWQQKVAENQTKIDPQQEFADACRKEGLMIEGLPSMDGKWHRVAVAGDAKGQTSGSYRGFIEGIPAGQIMNFKKASEPVKWVATGTRIDPEELERIKAQSAARKAEQAQELKFQYQQVAKRAYGTFMNAIEATSDHPYLRKKQVSGETLRIDRTGNLIVPMTNEKGFIENIQTISPDGTKRYLKDGRKAGLMHIIPGKKDTPLIIAEGYATAKSLHAATGFTTVVAFDGGNLPVIAETLRNQNPDRAIVIAADDDPLKVEKVGHNPGLEAAQRAAVRSNAQILKPSLTADEQLQGLTDHNDVHVARGFDLFRREIRQQLSDLGISTSRGRSMQISPKKQKSQSNQMSV